MEGKLKKKSHIKPSMQLVNHTANRQQEILSKRVAQNQRKKSKNKSKKHNYHKTVSTYTTDYTDNTSDSSSTDYISYDDYNDYNQPSWGWNWNFIPYLNQWRWEWSPNIPDRLKFWRYWNREPSVLGSLVTTNPIIEPSSIEKSSIVNTQTTEQTNNWKDMIIGTLILFIIALIMNIYHMGYYVYPVLLFISMFMYVSVKKSSKNFDSLQSSRLNNNSTEQSN